MTGQGSVPSWRVVTARLALRRRLLVAVLTGIGVVCGISAARPTPPPTRSVGVAARDLPGGEPLAAADLAPRRLPSADVPDATLPASVSPVGRLLAAPMRRGEPLTDVRLLSPSLLTATDQPGAVAVPVRVADGPAALALVHAGDLVDVLATSDAGAGDPLAGSTVVHDVRVLATPAHDAAADNGGSPDSAGLLIVAASPRQAAALAQAAAGARLSVAVRRPL
jgi:Flp pilus assembly protein CpaB